MSSALNSYEPSCTHTRVLAEVKEGPYERVCKKVRTSVRARRFVRACVQEGPYERVCMKARTSLLLESQGSLVIPLIIIVQALHALGDPRLRLKARGCNPDARFSYLLR